MVCSGHTCTGVGGCVSACVCCCVCAHVHVRCCVCARVCKCVCGCCRVLALRVSPTRGGCGRPVSRCLGTVLTSPGAQQTVPHRTALRPLAQAGDTPGDADPSSPALCFSQPFSSLGHSTRGVTCTSRLSLNITQSTTVIFILIFYFIFCFLATKPVRSCVWKIPT